MAVARRWKSSDLELFPDDGKRYEIIDGELYVSRQPHWLHQEVCVQEYWIVDWQGKRVDVFRRHEAALGLAATLFAGDRLDSALFPGCSAPVWTLFEGLPAA